MNSQVQQKIQFELSYHATGRQRQRGVTNTDMDLVMRYGEAVDDGFVLSDRALEVARRDMKRILQRLDHLAGVAVIEQAGTLVTTYRADSKRLRRLRAGETIRPSRELH